MLTIFPKIHLLKKGNKDHKKISLIHLRLFLNKNYILVSQELRFQVLHSFIKQIDY